MRSSRLAALALGSLLIAAAAAGPAAAQPTQDPLTLAMQHYDLAEYAAARDGLTAALARYQAAGDEGKPQVVRAHLLLAVVYANGFGDDAKAIEHLEAALAIQPALAVEPAYSSDRMTQLLAKARAELAQRPAGGAGAGAAPGGGGGADAAAGGGEVAVDCATLEGIAHSPVDAGAARTAERIECQVGNSLGAGSVSLLYRTGDKGAFAEVPMSRGQGCTYAAEIPAGAMVGATVQYYIAAKTPGGKIAAGKGSAQAPFEIDVAAPPVETNEKVGAGGEAEEDEIPQGLTAQRPAPPRGGCGHCEVGGAGAAGEPTPRALLVFAGLAAAWLVRRARGSRA